jgi:phosphatidylinositol alpha-1,6-mannosyltransferase
MKPRKILFLNLTAFSKTGGIEKFNKCLLKALSEFEENKSISITSYSLYDDQANEQYFLNKKYKGFSGKRIQFVIKSVFRARKFDQVILGHINMAVIGCLIRILYPKKNIILITHGIEVWTPLSGLKKRILHKANLVLAVSSFTRKKLVDVQHLDEGKTRLFYNTIDPYFRFPSTFNADNNLRQRYGLKKEDFVLFTLTRLSNAEKYKGYDAVIRCLPELTERISDLKYVIAGKYDQEEKQRIDDLIAQLKLKDKVLFTGYIKDEEVKEHFQMSDLFIMPSQGEGFGIVFIEAIVCGLPVIAGNVDGSVDALQNGELGTLVNPSSEKEITKAVLMQYANKHNVTTENKYKLQQKTLNYFHFDQYKKRLENILSESL